MSASDEPTGQAFVCVGHGTGLVVRGVRAVAWALGDERPGIVFYEPLADGRRLIPTWSHPAFGLAVGSGSADVVPGTQVMPIGGAYSIRYTMRDEEVGRYRLEIRPTWGTRYELCWSEGPAPLLGIGEWLESERLLVVAWAAPAMKSTLAVSVAREG